MATLFESPRALVSGFCAAHAQFNTPLGAWWEYSHHDAPSLRDVFGFERASSRKKDSISTDRNATTAVQVQQAWWERFYACGIIGALETAGLWRENRLTIDPTRVGICFSSSKGQPARWEKNAACDGSFGINSFFDNPVFAEHCDWALREIARATGATGKRACPVAACASGAHAIALSAQWIEDGACDVVLCGAIEAEIADLVLAGYKNLGALSTQKMMRPFDKARDGFVPAPGAACLILESETIAQKRKAQSFGVVSGWSLWSDASSLTGLEKSGEAIARAMQNALQRAARTGSTRSVDYVNAHGTATKMNDEIEARAIANVLGKDVPVSSTKPLTGHALGAAGAIEAVLCLLAMRQNFAPPNLNLEKQDAGCEIEILQTGSETTIEAAMSLSYGFGGQIGVLLLEQE